MGWDAITLEYLKQINHHKNSAKCMHQAVAFHVTYPLFNALPKTSVIYFRFYVVPPYATSLPDWIEKVIANHGHEYESRDSKNVPSTSRCQPLYINIAADGPLDLPPYMRNIVFEFEQSY